MHYKQIIVDRRCNFLFTKTKLRSPMKTKIGINIIMQINHKMCIFQKKILKIYLLSSLRNWGEQLSYLKMITISMTV